MASVRAGRAADEAHAPIEAEIHYRRAIELWPHLPDAGGTHGHGPRLRCSSAPPRRRRWPAATTAPSSSPTSCLPSSTAIANRNDTLGRSNDGPGTCWYAGDVTTAKEATEAMRQEVPESVTLASVTRLCGIAYQLALELRYVEALALARDALRAAERVGGPAELAYALHVVGSLEGHLGRSDSSIAGLHSSLELAQGGARPAAHRRHVAQPARGVCLCRTP